MISAHEARKNSSTAVENAHETNVFKQAIAKLEESIKKASAQGKHEICHNVCYFDIRPFSSLEKDEYATEANRRAIKLFMEEHGYTFFYHSVMNIAGRWNSCFTCKW